MRREERSIGKRENYGKIGDEEINFQRERKQKKKKKKKKKKERKKEPGKKRKGESNFTHIVNFLAISREITRSR